MMDNKKKIEILEYALVKQLKLSTLFNRGAAYLITAFGAFVCSLLMSAYYIEYWWFVFIAALPPSILALIQLIKYEKLAKDSKYHIKYKIENDKIVFEEC
jgi:hypothetical protein